MPYNIWFSFRGCSVQFEQVTPHIFVPSDDSVCVATLHCSKPFGDRRSCIVLKPDNNSPYVSWRNAMCHSDMLACHFSEFHIKVESWSSEVLYNEVCKHVVCLYVLTLKVFLVLYVVLVVDGIRLRASWLLEITSVFATDWQSGMIDHIEVHWKLMMWS